MIEEILIKLRRSYASDLKKWVLVFSGVLVAFSALGILSDVYLPFNRWLNIVRSIFIMGPISVSAFVLGYYVAIRLISLGGKKEGFLYVNYRKTFSPKWRRNISFMLAALGFIFMYATYGTIYATFSSGMFLALIFGLVVFTRLTREEETREEYGIPDGRDISVEYLTQTKRLEKQKERQLAAEEKVQAKKEKKKKRSDRLNPSKIFGKKRKSED